MIGTDIPFTLMEFFTYPRLLTRDVVVGYDFGMFSGGRYIVLGNSITRELAENVLMKWGESRKRDITIFHESEPSRSKNMRMRYEPTRHTI